MFEEGRKKSSFIISLFGFVLCVAMLEMIGFWRTGNISTSFSIYGWGMVIYLIIKMTLSMFYKPKKNEPPNLKVTVVIPAYNESSDAILRLMETIQKQTYPIHEIFFVDDGSKSKEAVIALRKYLAEADLPNTKNIIIHEMEKNQGKRHAQAYAFEHSTGDIFFTMDSDGEIFPDTLYELMRPFADEKVMAATGHINARNRDTNLLTRLLDMRYDNAFRVERASQSVTGHILVCSGPISCYRREVIMDNLQRYLNQTVLGVPASVGDDRCLTNYAIEKGTTIYQSTAECITDVPDTMRVFLKQQTRWSKSFFRETFISMRMIFTHPIVFLWSFVEIVLWIIFLAAVGYNIIWHFWDLTWVDWVFYLILACLSAYARNVHYMFKYPLCYLMAPIYGLIHFFTIHIVRLTALATLRVDKWGTR